MSAPTEPDDERSTEAVLASTLHAELLRRGQRVATAESLTGGALGVVLSAAPGSSDTYLGGVVSYATSVKTGVLGVSEATVETDGVVSARCAEEMAAGVRALLHADYGVSTTGVAGPTRQEDKPVGLVYVGVAGPDGVTSSELRLDGDRAEIRKRACRQAVAALLDAVAVGEG